MIEYGQICLGLLRYSYVEVYYMDMLLELVIMAG